MDEQELMQFEEEIKDLFLQSKIRAPVHLSRGNEDSLIEIFKQIRKTDWVFSTHRSHYHALLHGIDKEWLRSEILAGRSIHINNSKHLFFTSAIVGGTLPIAVGVAMALKKKQSKRHVWIFVGDMASHTGIFHECTTYASNFNLPILFVVEDNSYSTNTPTREVWGFKGDAPLEGRIKTLSEWEIGGILYYHYERLFPHQGVGKWVQF